jgi:O-succinylbenzoic acid--CoA ligase
MIQLSLVTIHPDFKLQQHSFKDNASFLVFIKDQFPTDYLFLKDLLGNSTTIKVSTSGSTGIPKIITILKQAMLHSAEATGFFFDLASKTTALHCLSTDYIAGKMMWVRAIHLGWHLEVVTPNSNPLLQTKADFDFAAMVPLQVQNSLADLHQIKKLIIGGAAISYSLEQDLKSIPTDCYQTYGMTETITHIAVKELSKFTKKEYYKCLPNVNLSVDNRSCLQIKAPRLTDELVVTNDIVNLISQNEFDWLGRYDNVINSGGIKLFPEQIEKKLAAYIKDPFIIGAIADEKLGEKLVLLIESNEIISEIEKQVLKGSLPKYEIPKDIYFLPKFIFTKNDKINRKKTLDLL